MAVPAEKLPDLPPNVRPSDRPIVVYEQAVYAIQQCSTILEAKHWNDKAEALAAWAKIYADDRVEQEARALKLHAFRQIGRLADAMRPSAYPSGPGAGRGRRPGPATLLREHGIREARACTMLAIGRMPDDRFEQVVNRPRPPSPSELANKELRPNPKWSAFSHRLAVFLTAVRKTDIEVLAHTLDEKQIESAKRMTKEAMDSLGEFQDLLWRVVPKKAQQNGSGAV